MTESEKAKHLFDKFNMRTMWFDVKSDNPNKLIKQELPKSQVKEICLCVVDEILDGFRKILPSSRSYWEKVKEEIKKI